MKVDLNVIIGLISFFTGVLLALGVAWIRKRQRRVEIEVARGTASRIIEEAKKEANVIKREAEIQARDSLLQTKMDFDKEVRETRRELQAMEKRLVTKEENFDKRLEIVEKREAESGKSQV